MKRSTLLIGLMAVVLAASVASAATIDNFATGSVEYVANPGTPDGGIQTGLTGVRGGVRETAVTVVSGAGELSLDIDGLSPQAAIFSAQASTEGNFSLKYGSLATGGSNLNVDLSADNYLRIQFFSGALPQNALEVTMEISSNGQNGSFTYDIAAGTEKLLLAFSEISPLTLTDVDGFALTFKNMSNAEDFTFSFIDTVVPEPATMSLLALGGIAMLKRRKNA